MSCQAPAQPSALFNGLSAGNILITFSVVPQAYTNCPVRVPITFAANQGGTTLLTVLLTDTTAAICQNTCTTPTTSILSTNVTSVINAANTVYWLGIDGNNLAIGSGYTPGSNLLASWTDGTPTWGLSTVTSITVGGAIAGASGSTVMGEIQQTYNNPCIVGPQPASTKPFTVANPSNANIVFHLTPANTNTLQYCPVNIGLQFFDKGGTPIGVIVLPAAAGATSIAGVQSWTGSYTMSNPAVQTHALSSPIPLSTAAASPTQMYVSLTGNTVIVGTGSNPNTTSSRRATFTIPFIAQIASVGYAGEFANGSGFYMTNLSVTENPPSVETDLRKYWWVALIILAVLILIVVAVVFAFHRRSHSAGALPTVGGTNLPAAVPGVRPLGTGGETTTIITTG